jgi:hypothetical protein
MTQATTAPLSVLDAIHAAVADSIEQTARDIADDLRHRMSVPVVRSGSKVIRSRPGEPPRKDKGGLVASVQVRMILGDAAAPVVAEIFSDSEIAVYLEEGTEHMSPRPVWGVVAAEWAERATQRVALAVRLAFA